MSVTIGTFNLNNLFSRYNFNAELGDMDPKATKITVTYDLTQPASVRIRSFAGKLVKAKPNDECERLAQRIRAMNVDVLAVQEVEDLLTLQGFARTELAGLYPYQVLVEGNDNRFIDVGLLSRLPIGAVTSWRFAVHDCDLSSPVFSRDLLEVEILNPQRNALLFTIYNTHLKSHYVVPWEDPVAGAQDANARRQRQAEVIADIVARRTTDGRAFAIVGDMNDPPDSPFLAPFVTSAQLQLMDALRQPQETPNTLKSADLPATTAWTHRYKASHKPAEYRLFDHIWLSPALAARQTSAWIHRRNRLGGDGSDHDPAYVELDM